MPLQRHSTTMEERIKYIMKEKGLTQVQFAKQIGSTQNTVSSYVTGIRRPSSSVINNICKTFSVNEHWLRDKKDVLSKIKKITGRDIKFYEGNVEDKQLLNKWIFDIEYNIFKLPKPDITFFLDTSTEYIRDSISKNRKGCDREYLNGGIDVHETNMALQLKARDAYLEIAQKDSTIEVIHCLEDGKLDSPESIFSKIIDKLNKLYCYKKDE